ncbi:MAG: hypothetical protein JST96_06020 [Bacteroidetes bacterium]|nr:hypothetical protein [Bacteroidota bacterium]
MKILRTVFKVFMIVVLPASIMLTACKKDSNSSSNNTNNNSSAAGMSANGAASDNAYDDALAVALQVSSDSSTVLTGYTSQKSGTTTLGTTTNGAGSYYCASVTLSGHTFPITVTVDFGTGCVSADGITRSGSITYVFSGRLSTPGTTISATFTNYVVNGYHLGGTYSITNTSTGSTLSLKTDVTNGTITYPNDTSYSFSGTKTTTLVSGTPGDLSSYIFNVTGSYNITNSVGESLSASVTTPLVRVLTCRYVTAGVIAFTYTKGSVHIQGTLDYGNQTCDNNATITIGSNTYNVTLP